MAPLKIGLTGGIAAGKSEALSAFGRLGAATLSSDAVVHELLESEELRDRLVARWGPEVAPEGLARISTYVGRHAPVANWDEAVAQVRATYEFAMPGLSEEEWHRQSWGRSHSVGVGREW